MEYTTMLHQCWCMYRSCENRLNHVDNMTNVLNFIVVSLLLCPIRVATAAAHPDLSSYANSIALSPTYLLFWTVNSPENESRSVSLAVSARTAGWVALGISEVGSMAGADAMVGWVTSDASSSPLSRVNASSSPLPHVWVSDRFLFSHSLAGVRVDKRQDWRAVGGEEAVNQSTGDTWTTIHFSRLLRTGDCNDREIVPGAVHQLVWAYGASDSLSFHSTNHGSQPLMLVPPLNQSLPQLPGMPPSPSPHPSAAATAAAAPLLQVPVREEPSVFLNLTASNFSLPTSYTAYKCTKFLSNFTSRHHAIKWSPIIDTNAPEALHHMVLMRCSRVDWERLPSDPSFECTSLLSVCSTTIATWGVGGGDFYFPPDVGLPFDAYSNGYSYSNHYLLLQIHYTNPSGRSDIVDSSGLSIGLTPSLRAHEAGIMPAGEIAYPVRTLVPAKRRSWTQRSVCPGWCTNATLTGSSIHVFGSMLHMHTLGRQLRTEVYRDEQPVATLGRADYYDFNLQSMVAVSPAVEVLPGDELHTTCVWDSTDRWHLTRGGPSTRQEMCVNFLLFYPFTAAKPFQAGCFDICGAGVALPSNPLNLSNIPIPLPRGLPGWQYSLCQWDFKNTSETCISRGYGRQEPMSFLAGCKKESLCSSCTSGLSAFQSLPAVVKHKQHVHGGAMGHKKFRRIQPDISSYE